MREKNTRKLMWRQLIRHNALMSCKECTETYGEHFQKMYKEGEEKAIVSSKMNVVITLPGISQRQVKFGSLSRNLSDSE